jgi:hypothetical protein
VTLSHSPTLTLKAAEQRIFTERAGHLSCKPKSVNDEKAAGRTEALRLLASRKNAACYARNSIYNMNRQLNITITSYPKGLRYITQPRRLSAPTSFISRALLQACY